MRIYVVRHGESTANLDEEEYRQALHLIKLTQLGRLQAIQSSKDFALHLAAEPPLGKLSIFYSPLERARQTMEFFLSTLRDSAAGQHIGSIQVAPELSEINLADYAAYKKPGCYKELLAGDQIRHGHTARDMTESDRAYIRRVLANDTYHATPPDGESGREVCQRARQFLEEKKIFEKREDVVLFTHAVMGRALQAVLTTHDEQSCAALYNKRNINGHGEILMFEGDPEHGFTCTTLPSTLADIDPTQPLPSNRRADRDYTWLTEKDGKMFGR